MSELITSANSSLAPRPPPEFVHLNVHSEYSLMDSVVRIPALVNAVADAGMPAVAITDFCNLFALVKFYRAAERRGIKPIVGADLRVQDEDDAGEDHRVVLLCRDAEGYRALSRLLSRAYLEGQEGASAHPRVRFAWIAEDAEHLIALSGGTEGEVGRALLAGRDAHAELALARWREVFSDRYYLEVQRTGRRGDEEHLQGAVALASRTGTPLIATNDVRFLEPQDFNTHEARVCIHDGYTLADERRPKRYTDQQFLRTPVQMHSLFEDLPEALENAVHLARRCNLVLDLGHSVLPAFALPDGMSEVDFLRSESERGLAFRREDRGSYVSDEAYVERLAIELKVIRDMGFDGYFLIVADFVRWARENSVPVGPGRGSGAGSLVAYALGITDLDPLEHELLFERFLNPERVSMPDFDIDFCMDGRDRVIDYVAQRYGRDRVAQIITFGSMAARAVVRDAGRVLGHPYGFVDRIAKLIPMEIGITLSAALQSDEELKRLYRSEEDVEATVNLARSLEGLARNAGKHAGGVVIAPTALTDFTPLYCEQGGASKVTQLDKDDVEAAGLVKFDFLGLRTLTIIDHALRTINATRASQDQPPIDIARIPMEDPESFALLKRCETVAVFQLESRGMRELIKRLQPDRFGDIVALVALFRPGPLQSGMVEDFIRRKHGEEPIVYPHPDLEAILEPTYGVILYQEQVMQIAQVLAGYSLGGADLLRRAMGKKKAEEMAKQRSVFMDGARAGGVDEQVATHIFDLMEKFAGYGFNKSHSAAYALLSYQTAWLKAHYRAAFMAAVLSADMEHTDKIMTLIDECNTIGLQVKPPDVNRSSHMFTAPQDNAIRYGLGAIKGVGQGAVEAILAERTENGPYADLSSFCQRIDLQKANRRVLEALIRAGALDPLGANRATLMSHLSNAIRAADQQARDSAAGQEDLFGVAQPGPPDAREEASANTLKAVPEWSEQERLAGERDTLGLYLTGHPYSQYERELRPLTSGKLGDILGDAPTAADRQRSYAVKRKVTIAGLAIELRKRGPRTTIMLDDRSGRIEVSVFEEVYNRFRTVIAKDTILLIEGGLRYDEFLDGWRATADTILDLEQARERYAKRMDIVWSANGDTAQAATGEAPGADFVAALRDILAPYRGGDCRICICYTRENARARIELGEDWAVKPTREMMERLHRLAGEQAIHLVYQRS